MSIRIASDVHIVARSEGYNVRTFLHPVGEDIDASGVATINIIVEPHQGKAQQPVPAAPEGLLPPPSSSEKSDFDGATGSVSFAVDIGRNAGCLCAVRLRDVTIASLGPSKSGFGADWQFADIQSLEVSSSGGTSWQAVTVSGAEVTDDGCGILVTLASPAAFRFLRGTLAWAGELGESALRPLHAALELVGVTAPSVIGISQGTVPASCVKVSSKIGRKHPTDAVHGWTPAANDESREMTVFLGDRFALEAVRLAVAGDNPEKLRVGAYTVMRGAPLSGDPADRGSYAFEVVSPGASGYLPRMVAPSAVEQASSVLARKPSMARSSARKPWAGLKRATETHAFQLAEDASPIGNVGWSFRLTLRPQLKLGGVVPELFGTWLPQCLGFGLEDRTHDAAAVGGAGGGGGAVVRKFSLLSQGPVVGRCGENVGPFPAVMAASTAVPPRGSALPSHVHGPSSVGGQSRAGSGLNGTARGGKVSGSIGSSVESIGAGDVEPPMQWPRAPRVHAGDRWEPLASDPDPWLAIDLGRGGALVTGFAFQGFPGVRPGDKGKWFETMGVEFGVSGEGSKAAAMGPRCSVEAVDWIPYTEDGSPVLFRACTGPVIITACRLGSPVHARYVRFRPGPGKSGALRLEIYGCRPSRWTSDASGDLIHKTTGGIAHRPVALRASRKSTGGSTDKSIPLAPVVMAISYPHAAPTLGAGPGPDGAALKRDSNVSDTSTVPSAGMVRPVTSGSSLPTLASPSTLSPSLEEDPEVISMVEAVLRGMSIERVVEAVVSRVATVGVAGVSNAGGGQADADGSSLSVVQGRRSRGASLSRTSSAASSAGSNNINISNNKTNSNNNSKANYKIGRRGSARQTTATSTSSPAKANARRYMTSDSQQSAELSEPVTGLEIDLNKPGLAGRMGSAELVPKSSAQTNASEASRRRRKKKRRSSKSIGDKLSHTDSRGDDQDQDQERPGAARVSNTDDSLDEIADLLHAHRGSADNLLVARRMSGADETVQVRPGDKIPSDKIPILTGDGGDGANASATGAKAAGATNSGGPPSRKTIDQVMRRPSQMGAVPEVREEEEELTHVPEDKPLRGAHRAWHDSGEGSDTASVRALDDAESSKCRCAVM